MRFTRRFFLLATILLLLSLNLFTFRQTSYAADRSWVWTRWDVDITNINTRANSFHVLESHQITVTEGSFGGGDRSISRNRLTDIRNVKVTDGETPLRYIAANSAKNCPTTPGIFCLFTINGGQDLDIWYNFAQRAFTGNRRNIRIEYDITGALRSYPDGDQLWWSPLATTRDFPLQASRVTVTLPDGLPLIKAATYPDNWLRNASGNSISFEAPGGIGQHDGPEVRLQYQHDPSMAVPPWQATFDTEQVFWERTGPLASLGLLILTGLIGIGGPLFVLIRYQTSGRDPAAVVVPEYLSEPPSDVPPGIIGTLLDEKADLQDILATILDLARRGYIVIEQAEGTGFFNRTPEFVFHRTEKSSPQHGGGLDFSSITLSNIGEIGAALTRAKNRATSTEIDPQTGLRNYEQMLLDAIFRGSAATTKLSELRNRFYSHIPALKENLYREVVANGFFNQSPEQTRNNWGCMAFLLIALAGAGVFVLFQGIVRVPRQLPLLPAPLFGLGLSGLAMLFAASYMPAKTQIGSQEAAKWRAFRTYLKNIKRYTDVSQATEQFERYIGYAVAFGLANEWIHNFSDALTSMPTWYYPTYLGGPWGGGYHQGRPITGGGLGDIGNMGSGSGGLTGGLNDMSGNLTQGLNAMSAGLTGLLNSASSVMTSQPSSSSSGGSGGWSGGGGFSGGSSGGGSAGGH
jgi:hypothetical protein